jgi:hypothetical protein
MWSVQAVGDTAGQVWNFLDSKGKSTLTAVERNIGALKLLVDMAIGWLAREGKIELVQEKRSVWVWLT